jgi:4'-phosphopantetheinyl transferase
MTELWLVDLKKAAPALAELEAETQRLSCDDRRRALRLPDREAQRLRLAAYSALRVALERLAGRRVRQRAYGRTCHGAPYLAGVPVRFNLSHTHGVALIGVTHLRAIGVDVESVRAVRISAHRRQEIQAVASGLASKSVIGSSMDRKFLQAWARLEAFAKAQGLGLGRVLVDLRVRGPAREALSPTGIEEAARAETLRTALRVIDLDLGANLLGAVALAASARPPQLRRFPSDVAGVRRLLVPASKRANPEN